MTYTASTSAESRGAVHVFRLLFLSVLFFSNTYCCTQAAAQAASLHRHLAARPLHTVADVLRTARVGF